MGLDCVAYSHLEAVGLHTERFCSHEDEEGDLAHISAFVITPDFLTSMDGLPVLANTIIGGASNTPLDYPNGGCYRKTEQTEAFHFHAGSYGGYGRWRMELANQFNPYRNQQLDERGHLIDYDAPDPDKPFYELIWFADNEGTIGPLAAARLLADFREHAAAYTESHGHDAYDIDRYSDWMRACELASMDGLIAFH